MCGIAGSLADRHNDAISSVNAMISHMRHRGPDNKRLWVHPKHISGKDMILGQTRLAIIDLSEASNQPMIDRDTGVALVYNGEIYNFRELRSILKKHGHVFDSEGDAEIILKGYIQWGKEVLTKLNGMFAFALWDDRESVLFLARDRMGIKPLYYGWSVNGGFYFASEVRALLASGAFAKKIDPDGLRSYLFYGSVIRPQTIVKGIKELPPATWMIVAPNGKISQGLYWNLVDAGKNLSYPEKREEIVSEIKKMLQESVSSHLVSDVPLGIFLSGGIDSSAITALATRYRDSIYSFSVIFDEKEFDESHWSEMIAREYNTFYKKVYINPDKLLTTITEAVGSYDQPSYDGVNTYIISKAAKEAGLTVALSGLGSDELFLGYACVFNGAKRALKLGWYLSHMPGRLKEILGRGLEGIMANTIASQKILGFIRSQNTLLDAYLIIRSLFPKNIVDSLMGTSSSASDGLSAQSLSRLTNLMAGNDDLNVLSRLEIEFYLGNILLRDSDQMSMANSFEIRVPYMDHRLVELALSIPGYEKLSGKYPKSMLVDALNGLLPKELVTRKKMGFTLPFDQWMKGRLKDILMATFFNSNAFGGLDLNSKIVSGLVKDYFDGKLNVGWARIWQLYVLDAWCRKNIVGTS